MAESEDLPPLGAMDPLGRSVFSSREAQRWRKGLGKHDTFLGAPNEISLSVDRLDHASDEVMAEIGDRIARARGSDRSFYGWAVVTVGQASKMGRTVRATPLSNNPYHADIDLNIPLSGERRDMQKQHALDLSTVAQWRERPPTD